MAGYYATKAIGLGFKDKRSNEFLGYKGMGFVYEYKLIRPIPNVVHVCGSWSRAGDRYLNFLRDSGLVVDDAKFTLDKEGKRVWNRLAGDSDLLQSCKLWSGVWVPGYENQLFMCGGLVSTYFELVAVYEVGKKSGRRRIDPETNTRYAKLKTTVVRLRNPEIGKPQTREEEDEEYKAEWEERRFKFKTKPHA